MLLLVCFGAMLPTAASPIRVCLLETGVPEEAPSNKKAGKSECCDECETHQHEECCAELKSVPDSTLPDWHVEMPDMAVVDLPPLVSAGPAVWFVAGAVFHPSAPIRGPDPQGCRRALLAVWRI
ncbi:hypothetical protein JIN84_22280 [Luteolibacter yonseiensis]|uniref:Uncharacterized protein n=2 Tax=Luteolibacter yonseiensis TaxID=1144680 RepID=A0A934VCI0_9BACT|nr:hypothetical protein [Luteolibacter yonseiensis]MBK1818363.1 hypothetical protein [Luteolibacter yonseiensis]